MSTQWQIAKIWQFSSSFVACPENQIRFGDHCYEELETKKQTIEENANQCEDKLGQWLLHSLRTDGKATEQA